MTQMRARYQSILRQAQQLPQRSRRQLAEALLRPPNGDEQAVIVSVHRLRPSGQARFQDLMDRHNAGELRPAEREALKGLVAHYEALMLHNTQTLLQATYPEFFTRTGRLRQKQLERAARQKTRAKNKIGSD